MWPQGTSGDVFAVPTNGRGRPVNLTVANTLTLSNNSSIAAATNIVVREANRTMLT